MITTKVGNIDNKEVHTQYIGNIHVSGRVLYGDGHNIKLFKVKSYIPNFFRSRGGDFQIIDPRHRPSNGITNII